MRNANYNKQIDKDGEIKERGNDLKNIVDEQMQIFRERLKKHFAKKETMTYEELGKYTYASRQTLSEWCKNSRTPTNIADLCTIANLLDCEVGYLVGEFDCKKREVADIQEEIGLSEKAIENLRALNVASSEYMHIISSLIEDETFIPFMNVINLYINENIVSKDIISHLIDTITNIKNYCDVGDVVASEFCEEFYANCANNLFWKIIDKYKKEKAVKTDTK